MLRWNAVEISETFLGWAMTFTPPTSDENLSAVSYKLRDGVSFVTQGLASLSSTVSPSCVIVGNGVSLRDEKSARIWEVLRLFSLCINLCFCNRHLEPEVSSLEKTPFSFPAALQLPAMLEGTL